MRSLRLGLGRGERGSARGSNPGLRHGQAALARVDDGGEERDLVADRQHERFVAETGKKRYACFIQL